MKETLIIIDMQNDFIYGALSTPEARECVNNVASLIKRAQSRNEPRIYTMDTHEAEYLDTLEGQMLPIEHCITQSQGWKIIEEIQSIDDPTDPDTETYYKRTFGSVHLPHSKKIRDADLITICGVCTDICVISNALLIRAQYPNKPIRVISDACAGSSPGAHQSALEVLESCQIAVVPIEIVL